MLEQSVYTAASEGSSQDVSDALSVLARSTHIHTHTQVHDSAAHIHTVTGQPIYYSQRGSLAFRTLFIQCHSKT